MDHSSRIHGSYQDSGHHVDSVLNHGASVETHPQSADIDHSVYTISPVEVARNAARSSSGLDFGHESDDLENAILEPHGSADMLKDIGGSASPAAGPLPVSGEESLPFLVREDSQALPSLDASAGPNTGCLGGHSVELELEPSPQAKKQKRKSRKRKQFFDASLVLTNEEMKRQLDDTGGIVRKRQKLPRSAFDNWMFLKNTQKEQIFDGPLLPGICIKLQEILDRTIPTQVNAAPPNSVDDMDVEIERARDDGTHAEAIFEPMPSPSEREEPSLVHPSDSSVPRTTITPEPEVQWRPEILTSYEQLEPGTSPADIGEALVPEMAHSPEVPGLQQSPVEDLLFLDTESTPSGQGTSELDTMSARTRLVANFFKEQSPMTQLSDDRSGQLSLTTILQGKTRKQCARMFFETLVLKTCDLVDVNQEEAYGDILVTLTPSLSKSTL
ncbi:unnamed protein product [Spirodela intermedia]|uniref:Rad21/Rec8-like protein C-terminal eukaryotic domain-containing protein n=1 Tax=Spirodela intermedia TaxID=51605 RepID=A0A7I8KNJ1_SPIIN|nr:unnamed protein product [Spirodela intermedia]